MKHDARRLPFELDQRAEAAALTAHAGVPLLIEAFRTSGAAAVVDAKVVIKRRQRGLTPAELVEGLFSLWAAGGERCEDLAPLRDDAALALLLGHGLPAPHGSGLRRPEGRLRRRATSWAPSTRWSRRCGGVSDARSRAKASGSRAWRKPIVG